jgi:hypothetical protein
LADFNTLYFNNKISLNVGIVAFKIYYEFYKMKIIFNDLLGEEKEGK